MCQSIMKRTKSRTFISRTISRVRSRLSSLNSLKSHTETPNPLIAPPAISNTIATPTRTPKLRSNRQRTSCSNPPSVTQHGEAASTSPLDRAVNNAIVGRCPAIATLHVKTSTWTVFGEHPKYPATAYVNIDMACEKMKLAAQYEQDRQHGEDIEYAGHLFDMSFETTLAGPGILIKQYGHASRQEMRQGDRWLVVLHLGIKDTSLASKLSTSFRSLGGRLGRISNVDVINRWLDVLHKDTVQQDAEKQKLLVSLKVTFRHGLLPDTTLLTEERAIDVALTEDEVARARLEGVKLDGGDDEAEDEERLREFRVLGAPWM